MEAKKKRKIALFLGSFCMAIGALNLILSFVIRMETGSPLLVTGIGALTTGIILVAVSKKKPAPLD